MPDRTTNIVFPLGGVDRKLGYQAQRPFTTPSAQNVRAEGSLEGRERGGSRPGLIKSLSSSTALAGVAISAAEVSSSGRALTEAHFTQPNNEEEALSMATRMAEEQASGIVRKPVSFELEDGQEEIGAHVAAPNEWGG